MNTLAFKFLFGAVIIGTTPAAGYGIYKWSNQTDCENIMKKISSSRKVLDTSDKAENSDNEAWKAKVKEYKSNTSNPRLSGYDPEEFEDTNTEVISKNVAKMKMVCERLLKMEYGKEDLTEKERQANLWCAVDLPSAN